MQKNYLEYHEHRQQIAEKLLLPSVKTGDLASIQSLLQIASEAVRDKCPLTDGVADYISNALASIHQGVNADVAFGIKKKRGGKDTRISRQRAYFMTDCVERLRHHSGVTLEIAIEEVARKFFASPDTVKLAWKKNHKEVRRTFDLEISGFGSVQDVCWPG